MGGLEDTKTEHIGQSLSHYMPEICFDPDSAMIGRSKKDMSRIIKFTHYNFLWEGDWSDS